MSRGVVEIPIEVWEHTQRDAERIAFLHKEVARLTAENERLRKAGDALMEVYCESDFYELERRDWKKIPSVADWLAAKKGRDAK